jgi:hypothetical protein
MRTAAKTIKESTTDIAACDWDKVRGDMDLKGYSHVPDVLRFEACDEFIAAYNRSELYRKTVTMERHRFGLGEYKYFDYPLPELVQVIRESFYPKLAPIANAWMERLNLDTRFPTEFAGLQKLCREHGQTKPTPLILKYGPCGFNSLHRDLYGEIYFPIQIAFFLNEPVEDYTGGEFVLTEQVPRAQSKAIVLTPRKGDMVAFTTNFRPVKSTRGYYRAAMKHGVSEVRSGKRHTLGVIFHDAVS